MDGNRAYSNKRSGENKNREWRFLGETLILWKWTEEEIVMYMEVLGIWSVIVGIRKKEG